MLLQNELDKTLLSLSQETERTKLLLDANSDLELQLKNKEFDFIKLFKKIQQNNNDDEVLTKNNKSEKDFTTEVLKIKKV